MRKEHTTAGFTMIELLFTIAIIGILAGILVPSLMSAKRSANDTAAMGYIKDAAVFQEMNQTENMEYTDEAALLSMGLQDPPDQVELEVISFTETEYCMRATHMGGSGKIFYATSANGITTNTCP